MVEKVAAVTASSLAGLSTNLYANFFCLNENFMSGFSIFLLSVVLRY